MALSNTALAGSISSLFYTSSPDSWVGAGETVEVTSLDGFDFFVHRNFDNGVSFAINDFANNPDFWSTQWWYLDLAAPYQAPLQVGTYYSATRFPFQSNATPGLDFSGNGRGNNTLIGAFEVLQADYADDGSVIVFAANFIQYDEGFPSWWIIGGIRYTSTNNVHTIPEPSSIVLLSFGVMVFGGLHLKKRQSQQI